MAYTVKKLAKLSGVSVRTLHHYDEVGLLPPTYHGDNGYRYYEEGELLKLQQILFFRELGFELKEIKKLIEARDFDQMLALHSHRASLQNEVKRLKKLVTTINKTIKHLQGEKKMKDKEMYWGFDSPKQAEYEKEICKRFPDIMESRTKKQKEAKNWSKIEQEAFHKQYLDIENKLIELMHEDIPVESDEVQAVIHKHYEWILLSWTPNQDSYIGLGKGYMSDEFKPYFDNRPKGLAGYMASAMEIYAKHVL